MENALKINIEEIQVTPGHITFNDYQRILNSAELLNEQLSSVEVTEDNIKLNKKLVAAVRKEADKLEHMRKLVKKQLTEPYTEFENQVKTIVNTVKTGEDIIRTGIRELEEAARSEKYNTLLNILNRRMRVYPNISELGIDPEMLIENSMLNKSVSINKAEEQLVSKLDSISTDIGILNGMVNSETYLVEYSNNLNLATTISTVGKRLDKEAEVKYKIEVKQEYIEETFDITVFNSKDYIKVTKFMNAEGIRYK